MEVAMDILVIQENDPVPFTIVQVNGRINLGNVDRLVEKAQELFNQGVINLVIDLNNVPSITSAGLRGIHTIYKIFNKEYSNRGAKSNETGKKSSLVKIINPVSEVRRILSLVGFDNYIDIYNDLHSAVQAINSSVR